MDSICEQWTEYKLVTKDNVSAALLVLAATIDRKHTIDQYSAELLGHEFSLALQNSAVRVKAEIEKI